MTILNTAESGIYPELIILFRAITYLHEIERSELIKLCSPDGDSHHRLSGTLTRWTELGLFSVTDGRYKITPKYLKTAHVTIEQHTALLPKFCRELVFEEKNCSDIWQETQGASDFVRGISWLLCQDIYKFSSTWENAGSLISSQLTGGKLGITNDVRWNGLRFWSRYLGFTTGEGASFQIDPTIAIRDELMSVFGNDSELLALEFLGRLKNKLPVLDHGIYRTELENNLDRRSWRELPKNQISMSLSFALMRLQYSKELILIARSDTGESIKLTGADYEEWGSFESVVIGSKV